MSNAYELKLAPWTPWTSRPWPPRRWTRPVPSWELGGPHRGVPGDLCPGGHGQPAGGLQPLPSPRTRPRRGCPGWRQGGEMVASAAVTLVDDPFCPPERHAHAL